MVRRVDANLIILKNIPVKIAVQLNNLRLMYIVGIIPELNIHRKSCQELRHAFGYTREINKAEFGGSEYQVLIPGSYTSAKAKIPVRIIY